MPPGPFVLRPAALDIRTLTALAVQRGIPPQLGWRRPRWEDSWRRLDQGSDPIGRGSSAFEAPLWSPDVALAGYVDVGYGDCCRCRITRCVEWGPRHCESNSSPLGPCPLTTLRTTPSLGCPSWRRALASPSYDDLNVGHGLYWPLTHPLPLPGQRPCVRDASSRPCNALCLAAARARQRHAIVRPCSCRSRLRA